MTDKASGVTVSDMRGWRINWPALLVLGLAVGVVLVLLILPDVDPPDTAFHLDTAPIVVHGRTHMAPVVMTVSATVVAAHATVCESMGERWQQSQPSDHSLPVKDCSLRL
ncbi:MAG TPA: hypothetical protein VFB28_13515 [Terriglobales bacterium]|nr:hypothetical protein [Terriglobales bacterium]